LGYGYIYVGKKLNKFTFYLLIIGIVLLVIVFIAFAKTLYNLLSNLGSLSLTENLQNAEAFTSNFKSKFATLLKLLLVVYMYITVIVYSSGLRDSSKSIFFNKWFMFSNSLLIILAIIFNWLN
jgi:hypothetical protein